MAPKHKSAGEVAVWVAAVGTALSGLAATMNVARADKPVQPAIVAPKEEPTPLWDNRPLWNDPAWLDNKLALECLTNLHLSPVVGALAQSKEHRQIFVDALKPAILDDSVATPGEEAISVLLDPSQDIDRRVASALYLGGHGKPEYGSPLRIAAKEDGIVGDAARTALEILREHELRPSIGHLIIPDPAGGPH